MSLSSDGTGRWEAEPRQLVIRPIRIDDDAREFNSGNPVLDTWLRTAAWQSRKRRTAATQVLLPTDGTGILRYPAMPRPFAGSAWTALIFSHTTASDNARAEGCRLRAAESVDGAILQPCSVSTLQIGVSPNRALRSSMKATTTAVAGRVPAAYEM